MSNSSVFPPISWKDRACFQSYTYPVVYYQGLLGRSWTQIQLLLYESKLGEPVYYNATLRLESAAALVSYEHQRYKLTDCV